MKGYTASCHKRYAKHDADALRSFAQYDLLECIRSLLYIIICLFVFTSFSKQSFRLKQEYPLLKNLLIE